jgi:hypothetical protein
MHPWDSGSSELCTSDFWVVLLNFGRFQRRYAPGICPVTRFLGWCGTLFKECARTCHGRLLFIAAALL